MCSTIYGGNLESRIYGGNKFWADFKKTENLIMVICYHNHKSLEISPLLF